MSKPSISGLRSRIGSAPLAECGTAMLPCRLAEVHNHPQAFYAGLRLVAIDGSGFELPDETDTRGDLRLPRQPYERGRPRRLPAGQVRGPGGMCHACHPGRQPRAVPQRRVGAVRAAAASPGAGHALHGRPGVQRLRAMAPGTSHGRRSVVALLGHPATAGATPCSKTALTSASFALPVSAAPEAAQPRAVHRARDRVPARPAPAPTSAPAALPAASPRCWTRTPRRRWSWRRCTTSAGRSRPSSMN